MAKKRRLAQNADAADVAGPGSAKRQRFPEISFLLFSDGRADPEEWRPNADESTMALGDALAMVESGTGHVVGPPRRPMPHRRCRAVAWEEWRSGGHGRRVHGVWRPRLLSDDLSLLRMDARLKACVEKSWQENCSGAKGVTCIKEAWRQQQQLEGDPEKLGRREMLEHLQRKMDLDTRQSCWEWDEFLRQHGLNKKLDRLLKSLTKQQVLDAWKAAGQVGTWALHDDRKSGMHGVSQELLEAVKVPLARLPQGSIVALLHEEWNPQFAEDFCRIGRINPFQELQALQLASTALKLKLVRLRIGATPEFSSKVVRCLAAAHLHDLVLPAVEDAINAGKKLRKKQASSWLDFTLLYALDFEASAVDVNGSSALSSGRGPGTPPEEVVCVHFMALEDRRRLDLRRRDTTARDRGTTLSLGTGFVEGAVAGAWKAPTWNERQLLDALQTRLQRKTPGPWHKRLRSLLAKAAPQGDGSALLLSHEGWDPLAAAHADAPLRRSDDGETVKGVLLMAAATPSLAEKLRESCEELELQTVPVSLAQQNAPSAVVLLQPVGSIRSCGTGPTTPEGTKATKSRGAERFMHYCNSLTPILRRLTAQRCVAQAESGKREKRIGRMGEFSTEEAVASARALLQQLAPTMAAISQVTYHRDVNAHNILVQAAAGGEGRAPSYGLVDFGLAVDASGWCDPSPSNPGGKSEWEFLDVGGDCRYWPVSAWRQFEAGCRALVQEDFLCVEYQTHLDLQGLGLTAVQVLSSMLPGDLKVPELKRLQELWQLYWEDASCYWASLLDTFRHGGDWTALKQDFVARKVYRIMADRLRSLRTALSDALEAAAAANLSGEDSWPPGSASLFWALLAMISCGERMDSSWQEVCSRISCRGQPPVCSRLPAPVNSEVGMLGYLSKLRNLTAKVHELSLDFDRLLPAMGEAR
eukprot:s720_g13.t3